MSRWEVPKGWAWAQVQEVAEVVGGGTPTAGDPANFDGSGTPWLTPADLSGYEGAYVTRGARSLSTHGLATSNARVLPVGTVLFSSRAPIGYTVIAANPIATNQGFKSLVLPDGIVPEYVRYYLLASREYAESLASGSTFKELSGARMKELLIPIPPTNEQRRIVAKLDELLASSRAARAALDAVPELLEQYRQAALAAAFSELLDGTHSGYSLESLIVPGRTITYGIVQTGTPTPDGVPTVRCGDIKRFSIAADALKRVSPEIEAQYPRTRLRGGEVLLAIRGSVGEVAVAPPALAGSNVSREVAVIPARNDVVPEYLMYLLASPVVAATITRQVKGVAQSGINIGDLRRIEVPLPPRERQVKVVHSIRDALESIDRVADRVSGSRSELDVLEKATFAKAFSGDLISQSPTDEPASELLARLRTARSAEPTDRPRRRTKARA